MLIISNNKNLISQSLKIVGSLGVKFDFFSSSVFEIQNDLDDKLSKVKLCSVQSFSKMLYLNEKNLIHGQATATNILQWLKNWVQQVLKHTLVYAGWIYFIPRCEEVIVFFYFPQLAQRPTPIQNWKLPGVPAGFQVSIKRDDLTGNLLSGNKVGWNLDTSYYSHFQS